jgi:hypothetical protein
MSGKATLIYLEGNILLSKKVYNDWREIQEEYYENFKTSLIPMTCEDIISFFQEDFKDEDRWPFSKSRIISFFEGEEIVISSNHT